MGLLCRLDLDLELDRRELDLSLERLRSLALTSLAVIISLLFRTKTAAGAAGSGAPGVATAWAIVPLAEGTSSGRCNFLQCALTLSMEAPSKCSAPQLLAVQVP